MASTNFNSQFVTQRRLQRRRAISNQDVSIADDNELDDTLFDTSVRSVPHTSLDDSSTVIELTLQVQKLTEELQIAHNAVDELSLENNKLKTDLLESQKVIDTYKLFATNKTPVSSHNSKKKGKSKKQNCNARVLFPTEQCNKSGNAVAVEETVTPNMNEPPPMPQKTSHDDKNAVQSVQEMTSKSRQKRQLCIATNKSFTSRLQTIEDIFSQHFNYCRYSSPEISLKHLLINLKSKICNFNYNDYCIVIIGESDFRLNGNYIELIKDIKECLKELSHTNIVLCVPTYIQGSLIHNYRVEMFNNLLYQDLQNNNYAYLYDVNNTLTYDMFSQKSGKINDSGLKNMYENIMSNILYDIEHELAQPDSYLTSKSPCTNPSQHFFRL